MILEHDIPDGSRLYFEDNALLKRELENYASDILLKFGFKEIVLPNFSYYQYQSSDSRNKIIKIADEFNSNLALKKDSTLDALRLISHRVNKNTDNKKWYYAQAEFSYPSSEFYKVGAEFIDSCDLPYLINTMLDIFSKYDNSYTLQISNINIIRIVCEKYGISIDDIKNKDYNKLFNSGIKEVELLCNIHTIDDLDDLSSFSDDIRDELEKMKDTIEKTNYENVVIEVFYYPEMTYYSSVFFRFFSDNIVLANGGIYKDENIVSSGFAIYIDNLIEQITKKGK